MYNNDYLTNENHFLLHEDENQCQAGSGKPRARDSDNAVEIMFISASAPVGFLVVC